MRTHVVLLLTRSVVLLCAVATFAGSTPANVALPFEEVLNAPSLAAYSPPAFSADQKMLAYVVTDPTRKRVAVLSR